MAHHVPTVSNFVICDECVSFWHLHDTSKKKPATYVSYGYPSGLPLVLFCLVCFPTSIYGLALLPVRAHGAIIRAVSWLTTSRRLVVSWLTMSRRLVVSWLTVSRRLFVSWLTMSRRPVSWLNISRRLVVSWLTISRRLVVSWLATNRRLVVSWLTTSRRLVVG